jgi:hypothetical protein
MVSFDVGETVTNKSKLHLLFWHKVAAKLFNYSLSSAPETQPGALFIACRNNKLSCADFVCY